MRRTACSACASSDLEIFLDLGESPIADAYTATAQQSLAAPRYPLQAAVCGKCRLAQLLEVLPAHELFGGGYSFYSSDSPPLSAYHEQYARDVLANHAALAVHGVVEIGCNDGDLLRHFAAFKALGVDPSTGPADAAARRGLDVLVEPFGLASARRIVDWRGPAGIVIANHVLAHVADVADCLAGIAHLLREDGAALVEVQYLPDLLVNNAFDLLYHEHRHFFSLSSLQQAAQLHGLRVLDAQLTDRQGGSLRATLGRTGTPAPRVEALRTSEGWLADPSAYAGMQGRAERIRHRIQLALARELDAGRHVAAYGAPAKATTLLNFCGHMGITKVLDAAAGKAGRYIPGVGVPIRIPDESMYDPQASLLLLAWNYAGPILRQYPAFAAAGGRWIIPFPAPVTI